MLVSAKEMLDKAKAGHYAVGQFNINNLEWTKSILLTAQEMNSPVILGVSEGAGKYMTGFKTVAAMVKAMIRRTEHHCSVALHGPRNLQKDATNASKQVSHPSCLTRSHCPIENVENKRTGSCLQRKECLWKQKLVLSVEERWCCRYGRIR